VRLADGQDSRKQREGNSWVSNQLFISLRSQGCFLHCPILMPFPLSSWFYIERRSIYLAPRTSISQVMISLPRSWTRWKALLWLRLPYRTQMRYDPGVAEFTMLSNVSPFERFPILQYSPPRPVPFAFPAASHYATPQESTTGQARGRSGPSLSIHFSSSSFSLSPFHPLHLAASPSFPRLDMSHQIPSATPHQQASSLRDLVRESLAELPDSDFSTFRSLLKELLLSLPEDPHNELNHDIAPIYHVLNRLSGEDWERLMETTSGYRRQTESTTVAYAICLTLDMLRQDIASQNWASFVSFRSLSFHRIHSDFSNFADISKDYSRQATRMSPSGLICA